jgi:NADH dehydrogenase
VEVAGEVVDCIHAIRRYYPRVEPDLLKVTLIHDLDRLLPELPSPMGEEAMRSLKKRKVDILLGPVRAAAVDARGVTLSDGRYIPTHTVICTVGTRPNALALGLGLPLERGRIRTRADMRVEQREHIWALGDCAWVPNAATPGEVAPPTAQFAVRQGVQLADNLGAAIEGLPTAPFRHKSLGMMAAVGRLDGVAMIGKWHVSGFAAWILWRAYYLSQMPTTGRKVRIALEWLWGMFFPPDITHLRFTRSRDNSPD